MSDVIADRRALGAKLKEDMAMFHGSQDFYKCSFGYICTEGIKHVADTGGMFWMIDLVTSWAIELQQTKSWMNLDFLVFKFKVNLDEQTAVVTITDGNDNVAGTQEIEYTDCPLDEFDIWCVNKTILLPSEY